MIYFVIILTTIIGISFILWYANRQDMNHHAPERPFLNGVNKYRDAVWVSENCPDALPYLYLNKGWYSFNGKYINVNVLRRAHKDEYEYTVFEMSESFNRIDFCSLWVHKNYNGKTALGSNELIEFMEKYPENKCIHCEDPHKTHWKYFLEQEMKAKKQREIHCHKYVDEVLQKQVDYNDLQINYQMLPSAPITDVESFRNFCKVVHEDNKYEDYEIQNYLLLKKSMQ